MSPNSKQAEGTSLPQLFLQSLEKFPDVLAVDVPPSETSDREQLTYKECAHKISLFLSKFKEEVTKPDSIIAILLPTTSDLYLAQLATMFAGAAYLCLDESMPDARLRELLQDSSPLLILSDSRGSQRLKSLKQENTKIINISLIEASTKPQTPSLSPLLQEDSLAYVIYTSGTTGRPKGVLIEHRSICNLIVEDLGLFGLGPGDRVAQGSSAAYDSSVEEIWLAFAAGATLVVLSKENARQGPDLIHWLKNEKISVLCPPPTLLQATACDNPDQQLPDLKLLYVGGEALPMELAQKWAKGCRMVNGYGPTECSVTALRAEILPGEAISIGKPVHALQAWILDEELNECPRGIPGELCIGGIALARAYLGDKELTDKKFPMHSQLGRIYRTGDLAMQDAEGVFYCLGRIDAQVKIRGHRIELEEVDAHISACKGVQAAGSSILQTNGGAQLVALVSLSDPRVTTMDIARELKTKIPEYMLPGQFILKNQLPTSLAGKLDRKRITSIFEEDTTQQGELDENSTWNNKEELLIAKAFQIHLMGKGPIHADSDFFLDLGGNSLLAAQVISSLRESNLTAQLAVRDLYRAPSIRELAKSSRKLSPAAKPTESASAKDLKRRPVLATIQQSIYLALEFVLASCFALFIYQVLVDSSQKDDLTEIIRIGAPLLVGLIALYFPLSLLALSTLKKILIGKYTEEKITVWGKGYVRHWIVEHASQWVPWSWVAGTVYQHWALKKLGAKIGQRVHLDRGVDLTHGGWDLLEIGDDVSIGRDATLRIMERDSGQLVYGKISIGNEVDIACRASLAPGSKMANKSSLAPHASLGHGKSVPCGENWDGVPAQRVSNLNLESPVTNKEASPKLHGAMLILFNLLVSLSTSIPTLLLAFVVYSLFEITAESLNNWLLLKNFGLEQLAYFGCFIVLSSVATVLWQAAICRILPKIAPTTKSPWSMAFNIGWIKIGLVESAGRWLSGTLFWPYWLRLAGAKIGKDCEISTIMNFIPELTTIGKHSFFADGIYVGGPSIKRGQAKFAKLEVGEKSFFGNHAVLLAGSRLENELLLGVSTVSDGTKMKTSTSWFGLPPFQLPNREIVEMDPTLTHNPSAYAYGRRLCWEALRFTLPLIPFTALLLWLWLMSSFSTTDYNFVNISMTMVASAYTTLGLLCTILLMKWALIGRVKVGQHGLWSSWCSRWDFLYVAWGAIARPLLSRLEGSLLLAWYLRAMGVKVGREVVLSPGFAQVVDPDMLILEDYSTVNAIFQAHSFEDRVLKIDKVRIGKASTVGEATVILYGATVEQGARVAANSVVMKHEQLPANGNYEGSPSSPI